jgi:hypothetical protein
MWQSFCTARVSPPTVMVEVSAPAAAQPTRPASCAFENNQIEKDQKQVESQKCLRLTD